MEFSNVGIEETRFPNTKIILKAINASDGSDLAEDTFYEIKIAEPVILFKKS